MPCRAHAMLLPCRSFQGHGTARPSRDGLWATCPRSASSGYHAEFHEGYQTHTSLRCRWPVWNQTPFVMGEEKSGSSTLQKRRSVKLLDWQFGYFRLLCELSRRTRHCWSRAGARHGMCELTHGMAGKRHGHGMLGVNRPLFSFTPTVIPLYSHTLSRSVTLCSNKYCAKWAPKLQSVKSKKNNILTCECRRVGVSCTE